MCNEAIQNNIVNATGKWKSTYWQGRIQRMAAVAKATVRFSELNN